MKRILFLVFVFALAFVNVNAQDINELSIKNVSGMRVVKAFVREDFEIQKFRAISGDIYKDFTFAENTAGNVWMR